jgi:hypothetical protein
MMREWEKDNIEDMERNTSHMPCCVEKALITMLPDEGCSIKASTIDSQRALDVISNSAIQSANGGCLRSSKCHDDL